MAQYGWPPAGRRSLIGKRLARIDGPAKVTGTAKYTYDVNRPGMLHAKILHCPHAHARLVAIDVSAAAGMRGVKKVKVLRETGAEIQWALDEIAIVVATSEEIARQALDAISARYEILPHFVNEENRDESPKTNPADEDVTGEPDRELAAAEVKTDGAYGLASVAHCCLEAHGQVCEWDSEGNLTAWCSTQAVSGVAAELADALEVPATSVRVLTPHMGGGFGSKFSPDRWGIECAKLARELKAPVKLMLDRAAEMTVAGDRPSAYARVRLGAKRDGTITAWASESWGSGGPGGSGSPPLPYIFQVPHRKHRHTSVPTNKASARAWRAPNHPQACLITMAALEDLAAALRIDPLEFFTKNLGITGDRSKLYAEQLRIGADRMEWKKKWHPRGEGGKGPVRQGLGLSLHTWGGRGHKSSCQVVVNPDGTVEARISSQDLGTGTRTVIGIVLAETLGLPLQAVKVSIGDSRFPASGGSGGSTTVGGVSASTRRAAVNALAEIFEKVAPRLGARPDELEALDGKVQVQGDPARSVTWKQAAASIGVTPLSVSGENPGEGKLIDSGVGGVQMAEVAVDLETGVVRVLKMVAVQDCGLIIDLKTAESQVYGGMIMGIANALCEQKIHDPVTGRMLNANMDFYKLPGMGDVGELVVHMMTGPGHDERGVIGLGEPPVISPGAAISNAVANAIGTRVPYLPLTPDRVLTALESKGGTA